jgi:hypothetical protein
MAEPMLTPRTTPIRRGARALITALAALTTLCVVAASAQAAATITITQRTQPAGDPTAFVFHLTGPACPDSATDATFELRDGQSQAIPLCRGQAFHVTQDQQPGWRLVDIQCVATPPDLDPDDAFGIDIPAATATIELSPDEQKACTFVNAKTPPGTPPSSPPPGGTPPGGTPPGASGSPSPVGATPPRPPAPAQGVLGEQVVRATASLQAPTRCVSRRYTVAVRAGRVRTVAFFVNGRRVTTVRARRGQRRFSVRLGVGPAVQRVVARVSFTDNTTPRTRTLRATVRRCAAGQVRPQFTG